MDKEEKERLKVLHSYQIMDTDVDVILDNITALASNICEVPISLISLLDDKRQWFKSKVGIDVTETPIEQAFCWYPVRERQFMQVTDATSDDRFADNPLVTSDPNIRFYAGCPLLSPTGHALGTLCVIDDKPKELTEKQKESLKMLAKLVMAYLEKSKEQQVLMDVINTKNDLFHLMSHEIKAPLNEIMGVYYLLDDPKLGYKIEKKDVQLLKNSTENLFNVVNELLDNDEMYGGELKDKQIVFNLKSLLGELITEFKNDKDNLKINYDLAIPDFLVGEPLRLKQLLRLCLRRFAKKTPNLLVLFIELLEEGEEQLKVSFSVSRADGLGHFTEDTDNFPITFTEQLIKMLGAELEQTEDAINFTLYLRKMDYSSGMAQMNKDENVLDGLKVLLVEDMETNRYIAGRFLDSWGIKYDVAHDGFEALKLVGNHYYDLILMDLQMPGMDGYEATEKIKSIEAGKYSSIPIIALTASVTLMGKGRFSDNGLEGFISKPFNPQELKSSILRVVKRSV
ncbi:response regulator [Fulvivirga sediminis]|uniref:histidine kinase n=1 Tax=Fulvivirga sediminis TaxID=2803949 RepID=A0A937F981_9BACT|nr:response regulator [Fulvivirga sediminis]MBL3656595.1 response regulator [Fulvivirga sediminis]